MKDWVKHIPISITVCDKDGIITEINDTAAETFAKYGGKELLGKSLYHYHPEHCNAMIRNMLSTGESHSYTISKAGKKKLIHQQPYIIDGEVAGVVEFSILLPDDMPHYERQP